MSRTTPSSKAPRTLRPIPANPGLLRGSALALAIGLAGSGAAMAQAAEDDTLTLETIRVKDRTIDTNPYAEEGAPYKARISGDERHTRPLAETPQTISVLTKTQIEDSGYTDLRDILDAQPGITLGTGENGNAFGDRYIIRGQEARSDVFVDNLRDPGMTLRESFATEQVEISKGPNSSFAGRGTVGGAINSITKQASIDYDFTKLSGAAGTDDHTRLTLDTNQTFGDRFAIRANALYGYEDVPDRDPADRKRKGAALSSLFKANENLEFLVDYYGFEGEDKPDLGGFLVNRKPADNVPVYGQQRDFLESDVDTFTARVRYQLTPESYITNATRYGTSDNGYVTTGARWVRTDASDPNGSYDTISLSTHQGWQEVRYLVNQSNLFVNKELLGFDHEWIFGLEISNHKVRNGIYDIDNSGANCIVRGRSGPAPSWCAIGPDGSQTPGLQHIMNRQIAKGRWDQNWQAKTISASVLDTVELSDRFTLFLGLRYDDTDIGLETLGSDGSYADYGYSDGMWNGNAGITYKLTPDANVYLNYATAADINGGESDVGTSGGYGGLITFNGEAAGADPERTESIELGTKWNIFDGKLLLAAALFETRKSDVIEGADYDSAGTFNTGKNRIRGIEVSATGNITEKLSAQVGYVTMDSEVLDSFNEANEGKTLSNFADNSGYALLRYQLNEQLAFGGAVKYESKRYAGQPDSAAAFNTVTGAYSQPIPSYTVIDLFGEYEFTKQLNARLNLGNITDKEYYLAAYRSGSFLYYGDAFNARLTLSYEF